MFALNRGLILGVAAAFLALAGGVLWLAFWDPKPPTQRIERTIPNERLPR